GHVPGSRHDEHLHAVPGEGIEQILIVARYATASAVTVGQQSEYSRRRRHQAGAGPAHPACQTRNAQARDAPENDRSSDAPATPRIHRPTGVVKPVFARLRTASGSGGRGMSATVALAPMAPNTGPGGSAARKNGST